MASPLLGYNNNVRHRGQVFHIQTEDSGRRHPHVITHLFADGGRILRTLKASYAEHLESEELTEIVRGLMKRQHKAMFIALREGRFDHLVGLEPVKTEPKEEPSAEEQAQPSSPAPEEPRPSSSRISQRAQAPDLFTSFPPEAPLDVKALEQVARATQADPPEVESAKAKEEPERTPSGRYAQTRPANIFSAAQGSTSIFGGDLVSERSLDEVILGYLAEDLDEEG